MYLEELEWIVEDVIEALSETHHQELKRFQQPLLELQEELSIISQQLEREGAGLAEA